ncbi:MAG: hypothetical protein A2017_02755 [Lentisphaerae bacterium GWF2_44_16]|nr:MAG: hypothetical protein A2017_02755 [Lentisphaerae bacterium GWF2_44_16]
MMKFFIFLILLFLITLFPPSALASEKNTRLALINIDSEKELDSLISLVISELSNIPSLSLVERKDIDLIIREKGLKNPDGKTIMETGKILDAEALLLFSCETTEDQCPSKKKSPGIKFIRIRLLDSRFGTKIFDFSMEIKNLTEKAKTIAGITERKIKNISVPDEKLILLSVGDFEDMGLSQKWSWIADSLRKGLEQNLILMPGVIQLERQTTAQITKEKSFASDSPERLKASSIYISGSYKIDTSGYLPLLSLKLTCARNNNIELAEDLKFNVSEIEKVLKKLSRKIYSKLSSIKLKEPSMKTETEAEMLYKQALFFYNFYDYKKAFPLIEAAIALNPEKIEYNVFLLNILENLIITTNRKPDSVDSAYKTLQNMNEKGERGYIAARKLFESETLRNDLGNKLSIENFFVHMGLCAKFRMESIGKFKKMPDTSQLFSFYWPFYRNIYDAYENSETNFYSMTKMQDGILFCKDIDEALDRSEMISRDSIKLVRKNKPYLYRKIIGYDAIRIPIMWYPIPNTWTSDKNEWKKALDHMTEKFKNDKDPLFRFAIAETLLAIPDKMFTNIPTEELDNLKKTCLETYADILINEVWGNYTSDKLQLKNGNRTVREIINGNIKISIDFRIAVLKKILDAIIAKDYLSNNESSTAVEIIQFLVDFYNSKNTNTANCFLSEIKLKCPQKSNLSQKLKKFTAHEKKLTDEKKTIETPEKILLTTAQENISSFILNEIKQRHISQLLYLLKQKNQPLFIPLEFYKVERSKDTLFIIFQVRNFKGHFWGILKCDVSMENNLSLMLFEEKVQLTEKPDALSVDQDKIFLALGDRLLLFDFGIKKIKQWNSENGLSTIYKMALLNNKLYLVAGDNKDATGLICFDTLTEKSKIILSPKNHDNPKSLLDGKNIKSIFADPQTNRLLAVAYWSGQKILTENTGSIFYKFNPETMEAEKILEELCISTIHMIVMFQNRIDWINYNGKIQITGDQGTTFLYDSKKNKAKCLLLHDRYTPLRALWITNIDPSTVALSGKNLLLSKDKNLYLYKKDSDSPENLKTQTTSSIIQLYPSGKGLFLLTKNILLLLPELKNDIDLAIP